MKHLTTLIISAVLFSGCAVTPDTNNLISKSDFDAFMQSMIGEFETIPDHQEADILDRRVQVDSPDLKGSWIYQQLNTGKDRKLYRQRISNLSISDDGMAIIQRSYTLKSPEKFASFWGQPQIFNTLTDSDIDRFADEGCVQKWTRSDGDGWDGYVDPSTCIVNSKRRNIDIRVESEVSINGDIYTTNERGFDIDMKQLWGSEPGEFIALVRK